jgi:hypothetical protein
VVEAYERLFFRVHDKQSHRFYLRFRAFDDKLWEEMVEDDVDLILKRAGFHYRGAVLDSMIRYYSSDWQFPDCLDNLERDQLIEFHKMLTMRVLVLSWVLPPAKIGRAILLNELVEELGQVIDYRRVGADAPTKSPSGLPFASSEQQDTWWGSWRTAAGLAMRTLPANTDGIRDVG